MRSLSVPALSTADHPAGQIVTVPRRHVGARVSALGGYGTTPLVAPTHVTRVHHNAVMSATTILLSGLQSCE
jgi:hypothetical protein